MSLLSFFKKPKETNRLIEARKMFQSQLDYWDGRMRVGDPLFDQFMHDAREAAIEGLAVMDKFEKAGYITGQDLVKTSLTPWKTIDIEWRKDGVNHVWYMCTLDGKQKVGTGADVGLDVDVDLIAAVRRSHLGKNVDSDTVFSVKKKKGY